MNPDITPGSTDVLAAANLPYLWIAAIGVFLVIGAQSVIYYRAARRAGPDVGLSTQDAAKAYRTGAIASIGPSLAVCLIAVTLISVLGTPAVLVRVGLIGSAGYEVAAAGIASGTQGATLGGEGFSQQVFATALLAMAFAGAMWMLVTLVATPLLKRGTTKLSSGRNAGVMAIVPGAALLGAFGTFGFQQLAGGLAPALVTIASALAMLACLGVARALSQEWLKEWGLGIALFIGLAVGLVLTHAGIA